jgi:hypothetical protein
MLSEDRNGPALAKITGFRIRIHLIRIRIQGFLWAEKKFQLKFYFYFFGSKITIYLSQGLHKGRPNYKRSLQLSKDNIQHFKT